LVAQIAPQLLSQPGFGPLTAAKLVGEIAGAHRFATPAKLARAAGVAPIPASSGNTRRQRLDQGGNRQINAALHRVIVTRARCHPETQDYIARRRSEGKTTREAIRCLKRYLARHVWRLLQPPTPSKKHRHHQQFLDIEATQGAVPTGRRGATAARRQQQRASDCRWRSPRSWSHGRTDGRHASEAPRRRSRGHPSLTEAASMQGEAVRCMPCLFP
jgi:hypothetical protein